MKNTRKRFGPIVIVIILAVLAGVGYGMYVISEKGSQFVSPPLPTDEEIDALYAKYKGTVVMVGGLNEYTNETLGFKLRLPKSYSVQTESQYGSSFISSDPELVPIKVDVKNSNGFGPFAKERWYTDGPYSYMDAAVTGKEVVGGLEGISFSSKGYCDVECGGPYAGYSAKNGSHHYSLVFYGDDVLSVEEREIKNSFFLLTSGAAGWKTYRNEKYGFSIALPASWGGYRVNETSTNFRGIGFGIKDQDNVFSIVVLTKIEYSDCMKGELCPITFIAENSEYVFSLAHAQDYTDAVYKTSGLTGQAVWDSIIPTFKFTK